MDTTDTLTLRFRPSLRARISLPPSKSISARALIVQALAGQCGMVDNLSCCDDTRAMLHALGEGRGRTVVDIGASGTAMRFLTAFFAVDEGREHVLTGTPRMLQRPIAPLVDALRSLGAEIRYEGREGYPPLRIVGRRLRGGRVSIAANVSSQYISALMMVGAIMPEGLTIRLVGRVASRPYIVMTQRLMEQWGATVEFSGNTVAVAPGKGYRRDAIYRIEPDWSAASYWYSLVALSTDPDATVEMPGLSPESIQGDRVCATLFSRLGVATQPMPDGLRIAKAAGYRKPSEVQRFSMADCPDLAQGLVVAAALLGISFECDGLESLKIKETDRMAALVSEMRKLGCRLIAPDDAHLCYDATACAEKSAAKSEKSAVENKNSSAEFADSSEVFADSSEVFADSSEVSEKFTGVSEKSSETSENLSEIREKISASAASSPCIATYDDHRMAMAFAPAAWLFPALRIAHPEVVSKSYPEFWQHLACIMAD